MTTNAEIFGTGVPHNVLIRRVANDSVQESTWTFEPQGVETEPFTLVTRPDGTELIYYYEPDDPGQVLEGAWRVDRVEVRTDGVVVETDERLYQNLQAARNPGGGIVFGLSALSERAITRDDTTHKTQYSYGSLGTAFYNIHQPVTITERGPDNGIRRTTTKTYTHLTSTPYMQLGLPATATVTENGVSTTRSWTYNTTTGFKTSETVDGFTTTFTPDARGNVATATKENGKGTSFTYEWGVVKDSTTPGVVVTREINEDGTAASETMANRTTTYQYDDLGRLTEMQPPGGTAPIVVEYTDTTTTTTRGASELTTTTDGFGRPIDTLNAVGVRTRTEYDGEGRVTYQSHPFEDGGTDIGIHRSYDALGRLTEEEHPDGSTRRRFYDDANTAVTERDEEDRDTLLTYRAYGHPDDARLVTVLDADAQTWGYSYDVRGNLKQVTTPTGHTRTWVRSNTTGLLTSETHPESGTTQYTIYDDAGVLKRKVDAKGTLFIYQHDGNDRLTTITMGSQVTTYTYEPYTDHPWTVKNGTGTTVWVRDPATGRVQQRQDVVGGNVFYTDYQYDGSDRMVRMTYPLGRVIRYDYDAEGRITDVIEEIAAQPDRPLATGMSYHPSGVLETYTAGNGLQTTIGYDPERAWVRSLSVGSDLQLSYDNYDRVGNVGSIGDSRSGMGQSFEYDVLDRLTGATGPQGVSAYAYDAHGNRQSAGGSSFSYEPTTLRLSNQNGGAYTYDANGNQTSSPVGTFTYTPENWLASASVSGGTKTYAYNGDGWRVKQVATGDTTLFVRGLGNELLTEYHNLGTTARARDYVYAGSRLLAAIDKGAVPFTSTCGGEAIPDGAPVSLSIGSGEVGRFTFEGSACRRVSIVINTSTGWSWCSHPYHVFRVLRPDNTVLSSVGANLCAGAIIGPVVLPVSGTYTVEVDPSGTDAGLVTVAAYDVVDVTDPLTFGVTTSGALTTPGQRGQWTFAGTIGQRVSAVINTSNFSWCGHPYHVFRILRPDSLAALVTTGGDLCPGAIVGPVDLPVTGTYTVDVDPHAAATAQVTVTAYDVVDLTAPLTFGVTVSGSLTTPGQRGRWTFEGTAGQRVSTAINTSAFSWCGHPYHVFRVLKPDNTVLASGADLCAGAIAGPLDLPVSGTYTVEVDPHGSATGQVAVTVYDVVDITGPLTFGVTVSSALTAPGQRGRWTFEGTVGQIVRAVINTSTFSNCGHPYHVFRVLKPDNTALATTGGNLCAGAKINPVTLPVSGTYTVEVDPTGAATGPIALTLYNFVTSPSDTVWANSAVASSQYSTGNWSAARATGAPNVSACGDNAQAWAPNTSSSAAQWLEATFASPAQATGVWVHETYNAGFITRVDLKDTTDTYTTVWTGTDVTLCSDWFFVSFAPTALPVKAVKIYTQKSGYEEIDAVGVVPAP
ncbi:MAG: RHS repeat protein [Acidobacteria bacterium]|nr:RHS repeat protein [Acidobacteriota bacterium]